MIVAWYRPFKARRDHLFDIGQFPPNKTYRSLCGHWYFLPHTDMEKDATQPCKVCLEQMNERD